jgi:hypothetical protein
MPNDPRPVEQERPPDLDRPGASEPPRAPARLPEDVTRTFERMEQLLGRIHGALDAGVREREHRELSYARLAGAILQVIVAALVALALLDWLLHGVVNSLIVKLAFAMVLQLAALTAFVISRRNA